MKLLFFKLKLAFYLGLFIFKLGANFSSKTKPIILSLFVVFLLIGIGTISLIKTSLKPKEVTVLSSRVPNNIQLYKYEKMNNEELKKSLEFWQEIEKIQPHSRDVLINISQLYSALQLDEKSTDYLSQAKTIDPNNPILK